MPQDKGLQDHRVSESQGASEKHPVMCSIIYAEGLDYEGGLPEEGSVAEVYRGLLTRRAVTPTAHSPPQLCALLEVTTLWCTWKEKAMEGQPQGSWVSKGSKGLSTEENIAIIHFHRY